MNPEPGFLSDPNTFRILTEMVTQVAAFLIFYWILKKYLWKPIMNILDVRKKKIDEAFEKAEALEKTFLALEAEYDEKLKGIEDERRDALQKAAMEGKRLSQDITRRAQQEAQEIIFRSKKYSEMIVQKSMGTLRENMVKIIVGATEKLMHLKMDSIQNKKIISSFIDEMEKKK